MAKISARGAVEVVRWVDPQRREGCLLRSDRVILYRRLGFSEWRRLGAVPRGHSVEEFTEQLEQLAQKHPETILIGASLPGWDTVQRWEERGVARATDGCKVEPDGTCPHGAKSWLLVLGFV